MPIALNQLSDPGPVTNLASAVEEISQRNAIQRPLEYGQFLASVETVLASARSVQGQVGKLTVLMSVVNASNQVRLYILWCTAFIDSLFMFVAVYVCSGRRVVGNYVSSINKLQEVLTQGLSQLLGE